MLNIGIVGCGYWGKNLYRDFSATAGCAVTWAVDREPGALDFVDSGTKLTHDLRMAITDNQVDAIVVATPSLWHYEHASIALESGKHVFIEKPMALNYAHAQELVKIAERKNRVLQVDHLMVYHPAVEALLKMIHGGLYSFGLRGMHTQRLCAKVRTSENVLWSLGPHDVAVALEMFAAEPLSVRAYGHQPKVAPPPKNRKGDFVPTDDGRRIEDAVFLHLEFPRERFAHLHLSWLEHIKIRRMIVVGEHATAIHNDCDNSLLFHYGNSSVTEPLAQESPLKRACKHFIDCCSNGHQALTNGHKSLRVMEVLEMAQRDLDEQEKDYGISQ